MSLVSTTKKTSLLVLTITAILLIQAGLSHAQVFKSVDENGKITFSDQAEPGADKITVSQPNTSQALVVPAAVIAAPKELPTNRYKSLSIIEPSNNSVIANGLVAFAVSTSISPPLNDKHQLQLMIDGQNHSISRGNFTIDRIDRGEHILQVNVISATGKVLKSSSQVVIFAYRPSTAGN
jgi:hypothetical protein